MAVNIVIYYETAICSDIVNVECKETARCIAGQYANTL